MERVLDYKELAKILTHGGYGPKDVPWWGESNLGGWFTDEEIDAVTSIMRRSMEWTVGFDHGQEIENFEKAFAEYCDAKYAVAINSCGTGLDMAMICLELEEGDEVVCPATNFKAAHLSIIGQGGKVVFCEVDPQTHNLDPEDVERRITSKTRAIVPVHMNGLSAPMDEIIRLAEKYQHPKYGPLKVIGDAARSCGAKYKGEKVGSKGWMNVFSFHTRKLMTTLGEGGAITTNDSDLAQRLYNIRRYGGEAEWGSNYKMTSVQAAFGLVQLKRLDSMIQKRIEVASKRTEILKSVEELTLPYEPEGYMHVYYVYSLLVPPEWAGEKRDKIISMLGDKYKIVCSITSPPTYKRYEYIRRKCGDPGLAVSEMIADRLLCLPLHPLMTDKQNEFVCAALIETINRIK